MKGRFSQRAKEVIEYSQIISAELGSGFVGTEHILLGLVEVKEGVAAKALELQNVTKEDVLEKVKSISGIADSSIFKDPQDFTPRTKRLLELSFQESIIMGNAYIGTEHLLLAILHEKNCMAIRILISLKVNPQRLYDEIMNLLGEGESKDKDVSVTKRKNGQKTSTPTLDQYSRDFTQYSRENKFDPIIGRDKEIERVIQILSRRTKNNPVLVGDPGVGKTAIIEGLAQKIADGEIPEILKNKRVVSLDLSSMVAGSKYRGEFEDRIKKVISEVKSANNVILFIDELHTIIGAGAAEGAIDASNILKPSLARGEIQLIGATTLDEYRKHIEKDSALERRFQSVKVEEPTEEEAILMLKGLRDKYEAHHSVSITDEAIEAAVKLSSRYISDRFLPDKAIDLLDEAASKLRLKAFTAPPIIKDLEESLEELEKEKEESIRNEEFEKASEIKNKQDKLKEKLKKEKDNWENGSKTYNQVVGVDEIADILAAWTGIPVKKLQQEESKRLVEMEDILHKRIIGQDEAVKSISKAIRRGRVGLKDPKRPVGSFLFLGPTGVGKTELCKALAEVLFGDEGSIIRVDMSEYMEKHSVSKLIGSPPGYVGFEEGGQLSEKVRRKPYSIILFDEVEKAHPDIFNIMLQVLEDGHITDSQGRKVDFKNTVIIMTSNVGARNIVDSKKLGFISNEDSKKTYEDMKKNVMAEVKRVFRPEFLNRIDDIIVFHPLTENDVKEIAKLMVDEVAKRVKNNINVDMTITDSALKELCKEGYDQTYGARPLRRAIQSKLEDQIAEKVLDGKVKEGDKIEVSVKNKKITVNTK